MSTPWQLAALSPLMRMLRRSSGRRRGSAWPRVPFAQCRGAPCRTDSCSVDVWQLGMVFLEMLLPGAIFDECTLAAIHAGRWALPACVPPALSDLLVNSMLRKQPSERANCAALMGHGFFAGVDWRAVGTSYMSRMSVDLASAIRMLRLQVGRANSAAGYVNIVGA